MSGEAFIRQILVGSLRVQHVFVGHNFVFGHKRSGNVALLETLGRECGYAVHVIPPVAVRGNRVSSTGIRELIRAGRISQANRLLGRYYSLQGRVVSGAGLGRTVLFPTLNLEAQNEILPGKGVYATLACFNGESHEAVTNVGTRPTFPEQVCRSRLISCNTRQMRHPRIWICSFCIGSGMNANSRRWMS